MMNTVFSLTDVSKKKGKAAPVKKGNIHFIS